jgi:hypothetical protein
MIKAPINRHRRTFVASCSACQWRGRMAGLRRSPTSGTEARLFFTSPSRPLKQSVVVGSRAGGSRAEGRRQTGKYAA